MRVSESKAKNMGLELIIMLMGISIMASGFMVKRVEEEL